MFCPNCGADNPPDNKFCKTCGTTLGGGAPGAPTGPGGATRKTSLGMEPKLEAALTYVAGWLSGLFFWVTEKEDRNVRWHAAQSIVAFGAWTAIYIVWIIISAILQLFDRVCGYGMCFANPNGFIAMFTFWIGVILWIGGVALMAYVAWSAYQGKRVRIPRVADMAEKWFKV